MWESLLQNERLLLAVGLLPAVAVVIPLLFAKKLYRKFAYLLLTLTLIGGLTFTVTTGLMELSDAVALEEEGETVKSKTVRNLSEKDFVSAFSGFLMEDEYEAAERIVSDYAEIYGWDENCSLMTAQLNYAAGNYEKALGIYKMLYGTDLPEEAIAAEKIIRYYASDGVIGEELTAQNVANALTNAELVEARVLIEGEAKSILLKTLSDVNNVVSYQTAAAIVKRIDSLYDKVTISNVEDAVELAALSDEVVQIGNEKQLNRLSVWRVARLKLNLLNHDFNQIVKNLDEYTSCEEYIIALELYLNDHVSSKELEKAFDIEEIEGVSEVITQLETVYENADLESDEAREVDSQIDRLKSYDRSELLYFLENELLKQVEDPDNARRSSKIYLSLAELSGEVGRTLGQNEYFSQALVAAGNSDDAAYAEAMNQLSATITGTAGSDAVKDVVHWASQAIANSSFLQGSGEIVRIPEKSDEMLNDMQEYTVKASAAITISSIDTTNFNQIVAKVQVSDEFMTEKELANLLKLQDCTLDITDFTVEKVKFDSANVILCCDNSGSMSGSIGSLQNAVNQFLDSSTKDEQLGFYTFDHRILQSLPLGSSMESIREAVANMSEQGNTNIYGTIQTILTVAPADLQANNVLILMTDGKDNETSSIEDAVNEIRNLALTKGYIVYVLGMGDGVEPGQLSAIAGATGGQFIYSPSDSQLESLYDFIHGQVKNQYLITYKTIDTLTVHDRTLQVELSGQDVQDIRYYSLSESDEETAYLPFEYDVAVYGLETRLICQQKNVTDINVKGKNFESTDIMYITLTGDRTYQLRATYMDSQTFRISVPADIAIGVYDMEVILNNRYAIYHQELTVTDGKIVEVRFGGYTFTAMKIEESDTSISLVGNVVMNGWLNFKGSVDLLGSVDDNKMELVDYFGSYISYENSTSATGYAKFLQEHGWSQSIPALGTITIYNAAASGDSYPVDPHTLPILKLMDFFLLDHPILKLYPDKITLILSSGEADLPFQDLILSKASESNSPFSFDFEGTGTFTAHNISLKAKATANYSDDTAFLVKLLDATASMQKTAAMMEFDTLDGSFGVEFNVKIPYFPVETYVGLGIQWKNMTLDGVQLHLDRDFTKLFGPVPVTFSDFSLGFTGAASKTLNASNEVVSDLTLEGKMQVSAGKVAAIVPKLSKYVGDVSVLQIPEATFRCGLSHFSVEAKASLEFLSCVELVQAEIKLGNHDFGNPMLGMEDQHVVGVYVGITNGFSWDAHNLKVILTGKGELVVNNRFIGVTYEGNAELEMNWWIFEKSYKESGAALAGIYTDYSGNSQFTVRTSYVENGKRKGAIFYITDRGKMDYDLSYKY